MAPSLLDVSAQEGARRIALLRLDQVAGAAERLSDRSDEEALHDFRVAVRRLRSCLRAYDELFTQSVRPKLRRRLKEIASLTGPARDAEVQLAWVTKLGAEIGPHDHAGVNWLSSELESKRARAYDDVREHLQARFTKLDRALRERLSTYRVTLRVGEGEREPRFAEVAARAIREQMDALRTDVAGISGVDDASHMHRARIHAKRLRYLLEPLRPERELANAIVRELKRLQDLLGDLNDLHNLASSVGRALEEAAVDRARQLAEAAMVDVSGELERALRADERPGLLGLLKRIQSDRIDLFATVVGEWREGAIARLETDVGALVATLDLPTENLEIERKFLLKSLPPRCDELVGLEIDQGYLPGKRLVERLRRTRSSDGETYVRTVKLGEGLVRIEVEEECTKDVFEKLWPLTQGRRVRKRRYEVPEGERVWEIDEFHDRELWLAEIELPSEDTDVVIPDWLAPHVERDVTTEAAYVNANLAR